MTNTNLPTPAKSCLTCQHFADGCGDDVCDKCQDWTTGQMYIKWEPVEAEPANECYNCRYAKVHGGDLPCVNCSHGDGLTDEWKPVEPAEADRYCGNCRLWNATAYDCAYCYQHSKWQPIEPEQIKRTGLCESCVGCDRVFPKGAIKCIKCDKYVKQPEPEQIANPNRNISEDPVNQPQHYMHGGIETIDIIRSMLTAEEYRGYLKGNILKYRERAPYKGKTDEDYAKAKKYHDWLMEVDDGTSTKSK
jgi:hypothetical protein